MARDMQSKVEDMVGGAVVAANYKYDLKDKSLELITDYNFSNTGHWRVQPQRSLETLLDIRFDFQRQSLSSFTWPGEERTTYYKPEEMQLVVQRFTALIDPIAKARAK